MVLDTNILVAYLKGEPEVVAALEQWRQEGRGLVVSSISFAGSSPCRHSWLTPAGRDGVIAAVLESCTDFRAAAAPVGPPVGCSQRAGCAGFGAGITGTTGSITVTRAP